MADNKKNWKKRKVCILELDCPGFNPGPVSRVALEILLSFSFGLSFQICEMDPESFFTGLLGGLN